VDFGGEEFSDPTVVAPIIGGALESMRDLGPWKLIVFQGTNFPEVNPAKDNSAILWPRNEWIAWRQAVRLDPTTSDYMVFGDYAADSAKMVFGDNRASAIRHIRYATDEHWRIQRGAKNGTDKQIMGAVYQKIVESGEFLGHNFSAADSYIASAVSDMKVGPGNSTTWRQLNTTHHLTKVVVDLCKAKKIIVSDGKKRSYSAQPSLWDT